MPTKQEAELSHLAHALHASLERLQVRLQVARMGEWPLVDLTRYLCQSRGKGLVYSSSPNETRPVFTLLELIGFAISPHAVRNGPRGEVESVVVCKSKSCESKPRFDYIVHHGAPESLTRYRQDISEATCGAHCVMFVDRQRMQGAEAAVYRYATTLACRHLQLYGLTLSRGGYPRPGKFCCYRCDVCLRGAMVAEEDNLSLPHASVSQFDPRLHGIEQSGNETDTPAYDDDGPHREPSNERPRSTARQVP